jgi:hypothetical protein
MFHRVGAVAVAVGVVVFEGAQRGRQPSAISSQTGVKDAVCLTMTVFFGFLLPWC